MAAPRTPEDDLQLPDSLPCKAAATSGAWIPPPADINYLQSLFFFFLYTNNNPKSQTHLSTRQHRCRRLVLTFIRDALLFSKRMNLGWRRSGGVRGQVFCICNYQIGSGGYVQLFAENHLSDDFDATCSHPIGGQSPALCFWVVFWFK